MAKDPLEEMKTVPALWPNTTTYTRVINAHSCSSSPNSPRRAQRLVLHMERPTARALNSMKQAWAAHSQREWASRCLNEEVMIV